MKKEITLLRKILKRDGVDIYVAFDSDDHLSETVTEHFRCMKYLSGFTGGDGYLCVTADKAALWTDGRYFIQAEEELRDSGIRLMRMGEEGCPLFYEWIRDEFPEGCRIGFDGRCVPSSFMDPLKGSSYVLEPDHEYADEIWAERPEKKESGCWILPESFSGKSTAEKLSDVYIDMMEKDADILMLSDLEDIAWLLNMRADDIPNTPVFYSYMLIDRKKGPVLYITEKHLTEGIKEYLKESGVSVKSDTEMFFRDISACENVRMIADRKRASYSVISSVSSTVEIIDEYSPCTIMKNRKNEIEMGNLRRAQIKDSVAVTRFMHYFKKKVSGEKMSARLKKQERVTEVIKVSEDLTERSLAKSLHEFREEQDGFLDESFPTISAYGPGAAMCHYNTFSGEDVKIRPRGLYLVDSGGHYLEGTTDITRTWACGAVSNHEKKMYTLTACANLRLAAAVFPEGTSMLTLDYPARSLFWERGLNYNHGTGHGVGFLLNVHEGPSGIRYRADERSGDNCVSEGVYVSDEPGFYEEDSFGIRLENMLLAVKDTKTEYGSFLRFDTLTLVPFDIECMVPELMTENDIRLYNEYHKRVYDTLKEYLPSDEVLWLKEVCSEIKQA